MSNKDLKDYQEDLYSENSRAVKDALDYFSQHPDTALQHKERISALRQFSEEHMGMAAVQVEVAAIILWNELTFKKG